MILAAHDVTVALGRRTVLEALTLAVGQGELTALIGPNGAGKSTCLRALAGLVAASHGSITIDDRPRASLDLSTAPGPGYLPQQRIALAAHGGAHRRARPRPHRRSEAEDDIAVTAAMVAMDVDLRDRPATELSASWRVLMARVLAQDTPVCSPTSRPPASIGPPDHPDERLAGIASEGRTVVVAVHDLWLAARYPSHSSARTAGCWPTANPQACSRADAVPLSASMSASRPTAMCLSCCRSVCARRCGETLAAKDHEPLQKHKKITINLALQGGGAHGAFTWGVLDGLLEEPNIEFGWVSGTSAGAVNAIAFACGLAMGDRKIARAKLKSVWTAIEKAQPPDLTSINPFMSKALASMASMVSPYDFNPLGYDPLRKLLSDEIDFDLVRAKSPVELLITATDVATGRPRVFRLQEMKVEAILASACLPTVHHAVEIDGKAYWDGGFSANPDLITLASESPVEDTLIVVLNHAVRPKAPKSAAEIAAHISEITFNQPFLRDVELIATARGTRFGWFGDPGGSIARLRRHRFHVIETGRHTANLATITR
jgi:NTE family protein